MLKKTFVRRKITVAALGALLTALITLGGAAPASAGDVGAMGYPTGCDKELKRQWDGAVAWCSNHNGGSFRAGVWCKDPDTGDRRMFLGPWSQGASFAYCGGGWREAYIARIFIDDQNHAP